MKKNILRTSIFSIILTAIISTSCRYNKEELLYGTPPINNCSTVGAKFSTDIKPIMVNSCAIPGCHNAASATGAVILETYTQVAALAERINQRCVIERTMPQGNTLTETEIKNLSCWISAGAPNN